jgi:hypothetical protein
VVAELCPLRVIQIQIWEVDHEILTLLRLSISSLGNVKGGEVRVMQIKEEIGKFRSGVGASD